MNGITLSGDLPTTELTRWRLKTEDGRQTWHYLRTDEEVAAWPQSVADKHHLGLPTVRPMSSPPFFFHRWQLIRG